MTNRKPRVLLLEAEIRTSERTGRQWYSAWLGRCRLVGFEADEPNERGHRVIRFYAEEPEPRDGTLPGLRGLPGQSSTQAPSDPSAAPTAPPGSRYQAPRPESARARENRAANEILRDYGDEDLNDAVPF